MPPLSYRQGATANAAAAAITATDSRPSSRGLVPSFFAQQRHPSQRSRTGRVGEPAACESGGRRVRHRAAIEIWPGGLNWGVGGREASLPAPHCDDGHIHVHIHIHFNFHFNFHFLRGFPWDQARGAWGVGHGTWATAMGSIMEAGVARIIDAGSAALQRQGRVEVGRYGTEVGRSALFYSTKYSTLLCSTLSNEND